MPQSFYKVSIAGGKSLTNEDDPARVVAITINDVDGASDTASVTLDDTDGIIYLPQKNDLVTIEMGRSEAEALEIFKGKVSKVSSTGGPSGRLITVTLDAGDLSGRSKEPMQKSWRKKTIKHILTDAAKEKGLQPTRIDEAIGSIIREDEVADGESFLELAKRLADETGGKFKMFDDVPVIVSANSGLSASGKPLVPVEIVWSDQKNNLKSWSIEPRESRYAHSEFITEYFDHATGDFGKVTEKGSEHGKAKAQRMGSRATKEEAQAAVKAEKEAADRAAGSGSITCDGNPAIFAGGRIKLIGARPGVDGIYRVKSCSHTINGSGYVTSLQVELPQGGAGVDDR